MSTHDRYAVPADKQTWDVPMTGDSRFTWEYDDERAKLLALYQKGKDKQWDAQKRIDWELPLDQADPLGLPREAIGIIGSKTWEKIKDDDKELDSAVRFQAQEDLAMPIDQSVFDWQRLRPNAELRSEGKIDVVVVAARREMVNDLIKVVRDAGLRPVGLDVSAFGLIRALNRDTDGIQPAQVDPAMGGDADTAPLPPVAPAKLFCSLGDNTNLAVARDGDCLFTRVSTFGIEGIAQRLAERRELTLEHARQWLGHVGVEAPAETLEGDPAIVEAARDSLEDGVAKLADEMRLSLDYYGTQEGAVAIEEIVVCGPGAVIPGVPARLEQHLGYAIRVGRPPALAGLDDADAARLTLPFGLGLDE